MFERQSPKDLGVRLLQVAPYVPKGTWPERQRAASLCGYVGETADKMDSAALIRGL